MILGIRVWKHSEGFSTYGGHFDTEPDDSLFGMWKYLSQAQKSETQPFLVSPIKAFPWLSPVIRSLNGADRYCKGFWGMKHDPQLPIRLASAVCARLDPSRYIFGVIEHAGKVFEHDRGWRSDLVVVRLIVLDEGLSRLREPFESRYQCDVLSGGLQTVQDWVESQQGGASGGR